MSEDAEVPIKPEIAKRPELDVRSSWFKGYIEGNALIPQVYNVFGFTTMAAVLRDPPQRWDEFANSWFTDEQVRDQGKYMSLFHKAKGISVTDEHHATADTEKVVNDGRLQHLWLGAKNYTLHVLLDYISSARGLPSKQYYFNVDDDYKSACEDLDGFFNDPENSENVRKLNDIVSATRDGFFSDRGKQLGRIYRATFERTPTASGNIEVADDLYDAIEALQQKDPNTDLKRLAETEFSKQAREIALEKVPEFKDNVWYANTHF